MPKIGITNGVVLIDRLDAPWATAINWHVSDTGYAKCRDKSGGSPLRMHRLIMERVTGRQLTRSEQIDHINGNRLDNRRRNLRIVTHRQNATNVGPRDGCASKYKGVGLANDGRRKKWMSYITADQKRFYLGKFYTDLEAAWMYDQFAIPLHGEFARLNFDYYEVETQ